MDFFDKAKELAREAQAGISQAEGLMEQVGGFLPGDRKDQIDGLLNKANSALSGITGDAPADAPDQADNLNDADNETDSSDN